MFKSTWSIKITSKIVRHHICITGGTVALEAGPISCIVSLSLSSSVAFGTVSSQVSMFYEVQMSVLD